MAFGYSKKRNVTLSVDLCATIKRKESGAALEIKRKVRSFYLHDDVSRMTPGCKQTITIKSSMITVKRDLVTTESDLVSQFQERLSRFKQHIFNIRWQCTAYRQIRETLKADECMLHIDFSENYLCKYSQEIQAVHFGGSHQQATLHTGVLYTAEDQSPLAFCSISPSRRHDPTAIWAHLDPVLGMIRQRFPEVKKLHFFSDGPATQYRNFYKPFFFINHRTI